VTVLLMTALSFTALWSPARMLSRGRGQCPRIGFMSPTVYGP
jgi:hypothetical protein